MTNPINLTPDEIKEMAREYTRDYFRQSDDPDDRTFDVDKALDEMDDDNKND